MPTDELANLKAQMLQEIRDDVKGLRTDFTTNATAVAVYLARTDERLTSLEKSRNWVYGTMTTLLLAVIGVIIKLATNALG